MTVQPLDTELRSALARVHRAVINRSVPRALSASLRSLPAAVNAAEPEVLTVVADSRLAVDRSNVRGPTLTNSHLLTFGAETIDLAIDVIPDEERRTAQLRGVVLPVTDTGPFDVTIGSRIEHCSADGSFRCDEQPFGTFEGAVVARQPVPEVLARFTLIVD